jgi:hypothetical protein
MPTLTISDRTATGKPVGSIELPDLPERFTLRELIRTRLREEVARYNLGPGKLFAGLVQPEGARQTVSGYAVDNPRRVDWQRQADVAIEAFGRNGFFVLVDGRQVTELDEELHLTGTTDVAFIKLTPLIGG